MTIGNITTVERVTRLNTIQELLNEGKSPNEIAEEIGMDVRAVKRNIKYLEEISVADITPEDRGKRRAELYAELVEASDEAKEMFHHYKTEDKAMSAKSFFTSWLETISLRMKLFGLDNQKPDSVNLTQINNSFGPEPDKISMRAGEKIANLIKLEHEKRVSVDG